MARPLPASEAALKAAPMAIGLFIAVSALVALCAKHTGRFTRKLGCTSVEPSNSRIVPRSLFASPKQLLRNLSNKTILFLNKNRIAEESAAEAQKSGAEAEEGFGSGGLWQRDILMGEKCDPLNFSGAIYYDRDGRRVSEFPPRSPRASPLRGPFPFPVTVGQKGGS